MHEKGLLIIKLRHLYKEREVYIGDWKNGIKDGEGRCFWYGRGNYEGKFKNHVCEGYGFYEWYISVLIC
jgi:hypothetical protein